MPKPSNRKTKKSFTLSPESVRFLEAMRKKRQARSASAVLEEILQSIRREHGKASLGKALDAYYSSLSDDEAEEQVDWGEFALREFPSGGA